MKDDRVPRVVVAFTGRWRFLSNFYPCTVPHMGMNFPSAEHAYQASKVYSIDERIRIKEMITPGAAKRYGAGVRLRADWESVKLDEMRAVVRAKFESSPALRSDLAATGDMELIEGNNWGDRFWGQVDGVGLNWLGRILMDLRASYTGAVKRKGD